MASLNFLNVKMVCPKVLTTGMPRMYSTASLDMSSSASWYSFIFCCMRAPVMRIRTAKASTTGTRLSSPSRQSNASSSASRPQGVAMAPARSGSWCARYVSAAALDSLTILRRRPLPKASAAPRGSLTMCRIVSMRRFVATRKAPMCEHISPAM